jgi:hypothetical protein
MNRTAILVVAIVVFGLAFANIVLGVNLVLPLEAARERGAGAPWYVVWAMIAVTVASAVALGAFLIGAGLRKK